MSIWDTVKSRATGTFTQPYNLLKSGYNYLSGNTAMERSDAAIRKSQENTLQMTLNPRPSTPKPAPAPPPVYTPPPPVYAPPQIPFFSAQEAIRKSMPGATQTVNTFYNKLMADYLARMEENRQTQRKQFDLANKSLERQLLETKESAELGKVRTEEDVARNLSQMATEETARQGTEARQFDIGRRGLQEQLGQAGLSAEGIGGQKLWEAGMQRGDIEKAESRKIEAQKEAQIISRSRTIDDLARGLKRAEISTKEAKERAQLSLDTALGELAEQELSKKQYYEEQRQSEIARKAQAMASDEWDRYLSGLKTPQEQAQAFSQYGAGGGL